MKIICDARSISGTNAYWLLLAGVLTAFQCLAAPALAVPGAVQFNRDIRAMMSENCFACHGPDSNARKAGLRLDTKEGLFEKTPKRGPAVVPGKPEQSELWKRITATSADDVMPPPESHKTLKPEQKELFRKWIAGGASWQGHWAYLKPERPAVPGFSKSVISGRGGAAAATDSLITSFPIRNPIDAFVVAKLQSKGLKPNAEADRR